MRLTFTDERVLAVVAHPDDAELLCAGTLARAKSDGAAIGICVLCKGEKGQPAAAVAELAGMRRKEMAVAARLLGARLFHLKYGDGELADGPAQRRKLLRAYRRFAPTLVLAHAPEDYHPDHRAASALAEAVSWFAASHGHVTKEPALPLQPAIWWMDTVGMNDFEPGFFIDISRHATLKHRMLRCHKSQLVRKNDRDFVPLETLMRRQYRSRGEQASVPAAEAFRIHRAFKRARAW